MLDSRAPAGIEELARDLLQLAYGDKDTELRALLFDSVASAAPIGDETEVSAMAPDVAPAVGVTEHVDPAPVMEPEPVF